ncbi:hypothetical protein [Nocardioides sp.]|uniref:hypothetical protein n=1 Tax=Nocardioides sp. TaxID=35761 RepID=UPI0039E6FF63
MIRRRGERGSALVEFTWLAILLMVPVLWLVLAVFDVQRGAFAVSAAARAAGRAYVLADSDAEGRARAEQAVEIVFADQGVDIPADIEVGCTPYPRSCHAAGSVVMVRVRSGAALPWLPSVLGSPPQVALESTHTLPVGRYQEPPDES